MALINCPSCNNRISDKAQSCQHCGFTLGEASAEDIARKQNLNKYLQGQRIQTQSMVAMLLFVAGFGFMYWGAALPGELQHTFAVAITVIGFVWYIVNRVRLVFLKRSN